MESDDKLQGASSAPDQSESLESWRLELLRLMLRAGGLALCSAWLLLWIDGRHDLVKRFIYAPALGPTLILAARWASRYPRLMSTLFLFAVFVPTAHAALAVGWAPAVVAMLVYVTVFSSHLMGERACYLVVLGAMAVFVFGGYVAPERFATLPPEVNQKSFSNWALASTLFACFTIASGWGLGKLIQLIEAGGMYCAKAVALLHERMALLTATLSRRSEQAAQLQHAQRFQMVAQLGEGFDRLFGGTLREIRTALQQAETGTPAQQAAAGATIVELVQSAANRTQDALALLRPHLAPRENANLGRCVAAIGYRFKAHLPESVTLDIDASLSVSVGVDESWLEQALLVLLLNAERAVSPQGGRILIQTRRLELAQPHLSSCGMLSPGSFAVVRVLDSGPGVSADVARRALEPFFSAWEPPHLGIGLTTVFEMVRKAGGSLEIETTASGASVALYLPLMNRNAPLTLAPAPLPSGAVGIPEWRDPAVRNIAKGAAVATLIAVLAAEVQRLWLEQGGVTHLVIGLPLIAVFLASAYGNWQTSVRLTLVVVPALLGGLSFVGQLGYMDSAGMSILSAAVLITWTLGSPRAAIACLTFATVSLVGLGMLHARGIIEAPVGQTALTDPTNWYRVAVALPGLVFVGAKAVSHVVNAARSAVTQLATLKASLSATDAQLTLESQSVANIESITSRSSELEALGRVTGAVAHDVNNCLQALTAWASVLACTNPNTARKRYRAAIEAIDEAIRHAETLLSNLDFSRVDPRTHAFVDLGVETKRVEHLLRALLGSAHTLEVETAAAAPVVTNAHAYHRALFNLVSNARDAMTDPGRCVIRVEATHHAVTLSVRDDGMGMDGPTLDRLFEPFFTTKGQRGFGLGLCSVATLASVSGGQASAWSELNQGTQITLTFPRASESAAQA